MRAVVTTTLDGVSKTAGRATGGAKARVRGMARVDAVSAAGRPVTAAALVAATGLPRPTVLRLLDVLVEQRVLGRDGLGTYTLGPQLAVWGERYLDGLDLARHA